MSSEVDAKQQKDQPEDVVPKEDDAVFPKPAVPAKMDIEKAEENKLRSKYPGLKGPGSSAFLQKRLSKGQKYFDSGDYNMAKAKMGGANKPFVPGQKLLLASGSTGDAIPTPDTVPHRKTSIAQPIQHAQHGTFAPTTLS